MDERKSVSEEVCAVQHKQIDKEIKELKLLNGEIFREMKIIRDAVLSGRPSWATLTIITILSSGLVGLGVAFFTQ